MNAVMTIRSLAQPLPAVLDTPLAFNLLHRRRNIGEYRPTSFDLSRFNRLLARLGRTQGPMDVDQLATAARQLSAFTRLSTLCHLDLNLFSAVQVFACNAESA